MNVIIEINGVRHRMVETERICFCDGAIGTDKCSLLPYCIGAKHSSSDVSLMKFCLMFPHKGYAHFEECTNNEQQ